MAAHTDHANLNDFQSVEKKKSNYVEVTEDVSSSEDDLAAIDSSSEADDELAPSDEENEREEGEKLPSSIGMANVMAKILNKDHPTKNKSTILSKGQTDKEIIRKKVEREKAENKDTHSNADTKLKDGIARRKELLTWQLLARSVPDALNKEYEKNLQRIATRGVVQLFNAVEKQQSLLRQHDDISTKGKKSKQTDGTQKTGEFLDMLRGSEGDDHKNAKRLKTALPNAAKTDDKKPQWSVLHENFLMGSTMKDWDKKSSDEEEDGVET